MCTNVQIHPVCWLSKGVNVFTDVTHSTSTSVFGELSFKL
jgi:hypothetical protein